MPQLTTVGGTTLHYEEVGAGVPVVLVHGWAMSGRVWAFQRELGAACRLIMLDLRGHGASSAPAAGYAFADFAADIVALFDHLELRRAVLLGWSLGAQSVLEVERTLRDRLAGLVLVGGTPRFAAGNAWPHGLPASEVRGLALRLRRNYEATLGEFFQRMFVAGELSPADNQRLVREIVMNRRHPDPAAVAAALTTLAAGDQRPLLAGVSCPALVLHGDRDPICLPGAGRALAEGLPAGQLVMFPGLGHAPFLSRPELFNRQLGDFIREVAADD